MYKDFGIQFGAYRNRFKQIYESLFIPDMPKDSVDGWGFWQSFFCFLGVLGTISTKGGNSARNLSFEALEDIEHTTVNLHLGGCTLEIRIEIS